MGVDKRRRGREEGRQPGAFPAIFITYHSPCLSGQTRTLTNAYNQIWFCICFWDVPVLIYSLFLQYTVSSPPLLLPAISFSCFRRLQKPNYSDSHHYSHSHITAERMVPLIKQTTRVGSTNKWFIIGSFL